MKKHGKTVQALQWNSERSQQIRFQKLVSLLPDNLSDYSITDAGCGFGDFYLYLLKTDKKPRRYIGLDSLKAMVKEASERTKATIVQCNILKDPLIESDFYCCSGAMNTMSSFDMHLFIRRCYVASKEGFIFNILWGEQQEGIYNYVSIPMIHSIAKELQATCKITTGYLPHDMSVALYKGRN